MIENSQETIIDFEKIESYSGVSNLKYHINHYEIDCQPDSIRNFLLFLKEHFNFKIFLDLITIDNRILKEGESFKLCYLLLNPLSNDRIMVNVPISDRKYAPSTSDLWKNISLLQRESFEMFGVDFGTNYKNFLLFDGFKGHPLLKDFKEGARQDYSLMKDEEPLENSDIYTFEPETPFDNGNIKITASLDYEKIKKVDIETGYSHRGFEKIAEDLTYSGITPFTDRLNYISPAFGNVAWTKTIEDALEIKIPERAMGIRMILCELSRIKEHINFLGNIFYSINIKEEYRNSISMNNILGNLLFLYSGNRTICSFCNIGGVRFDLPQGWVPACSDVLSKINAFLDNNVQDLIRNSLFVNRLDIACIDGDVAINCGITGPNLRASGINYDLRRNLPYYFYSDVDFSVPIAQNGKVFDRLLVRVEEIKQSIKIIIQVLENLPPGLLTTENSLITKPRKDDLKSNEVERDRYKMSVMSGLKLPKGSFYSSVEGANGESGFLIQSEEDVSPYRVKYRSPSLSNFSLLDKTLKNEHYSDLALIYYSLNINISEMER